MKKKNNDRQRTKTAIKELSLKIAEKQIKQRQRRKKNNTS